MKASPLRLGFLASHNGTDMQAIVREIEEGKLNAKAEIVISNNSNSPALEFARKHNIKSIHISSKTHQNPDRAITEILLLQGVELVILSGYMKVFRENSPVLKKYKGRIWNVHPADTQKYGGYWGDALFETLLNSGDKYAEPVIHEAVWPVDSGKELARGNVMILPNTKESLKEAIQKEEIRLFLRLLRAKTATKS